MDASIEKEFSAITTVQENLRLQMGALDWRVSQLGKKVAVECEPSPSGGQQMATPPPPPDLGSKPETDLEPESAPSVPIEPKRQRPTEPTLRVRLSAFGERRAAAKAGAAKEGAGDEQEPAQKKSADAGGEASAEMRFGRFWLVRGGVVMLLAGLVFLAEYARTNWWVNLPAAAKVASLYLGSFGMLGFGLWWEKRREDMQHFGRVLAAGGAAAVYYTTYAAHYVDSLRVIGSPVVAAILLLVWAALLVIDSGRRKSEGMAIAGLLLAYFTCVLGEATSFSYCSALVLTVAGAALVMRRGWSAACFVGMAASYLSFAYWRVPSLLAQGEVTLWPAYIFLVGYWCVFGFAALFPKSKFPEKVRPAFAAANNGAFLGLMSIGLAAYDVELLGEFWLGSGVLLMVLGLVARRLFGRGATSQVFGLGGLFVFTAGLFAQFEGVGLSISLALEGVLLAVLARVLPKREWLAVPGVLLSLVAMAQASFAQAGGMVWIGEATLWLAASVLLWRMRPSADEQDASVPAIFALFWAIGFCHAVAAIGIDALRPLALVAGGATVLAIAVWTKFRTLQGIASVVALLAIVLLVGDSGDMLSVGISSFGVWVYVEIALAYAVFAKATERLRLNGLPEMFSVAAVVVSGAALVVAKLDFEPSTLLPAVVAAGWFGVAHRLRLPVLGWVAIFVLGFQGLVMGVLLALFGGREVSDVTLLTLVAEMVALAVLAAKWPVRGTSERLRLGLAGSAAVFATVAYLVWSWVAFGASGVDLTLARLVPAVFLVRLACMRNSRVPLAFAGVLFVFGLGDWLTTLITTRADGVPVLALAAFIAAPIVTVRLLTRDNQFGERGGPLSSLGALIAVVMTFLLATEIGSGAIPMAASWAFAGAVVFGLGLLLGERAYRVLALGLLVLATGHVLVIDIWALGTLGRIASFAAVGLVCVGLGFAYNRIGEHLRHAA